MHRTAAVSRLLLLADEPRGAPAAARERGNAREHADARVRRYRLARLTLDDGARAARHGQHRASDD
jgi:hypothetical protein